ncbi:MAG: YbaN family protein [Lachnospiraceae bacterium]
MKLKRLLFLILGCLCLGMGCIGIALPIIPTVPFFLATVFCFANSSKKLHDWFISTKLYKKHLESFVQKKGMLLQTKLTILTTVTLLMGFGFFMMVRSGILVPSIILALVWVCHVIYFVFGVKTIKTEKR